MCACLESHRVAMSLNLAETWVDHHYSVAQACSISFGGPCLTGGTEMRKSCPSSRNSEEGGSTKVECSWIVLSEIAGLCISCGTGKTFIRKVISEQEGVLCGGRVFCSQEIT